MSLHRPLSDEARQERIDFENQVAATGIAKHLTNEALMLLFLALGQKAWRKHEHD